MLSLHNYKSKLRSSNMYFNPAWDGNQLQVFFIPTFEGMDDAFELPVSYNGNDLLFPAKLLKYGYTVKLEITVDDTKVIFEPDEERNWRAVISFDDLQADKKLDGALLKEMASVIETITK